MGLELARLMIEAMAKHLPPSASELCLLDINGETKDVLSDLRADLHITAVSGRVDLWGKRDIASDSVDAIIAYGYVINDAFLDRALDALRSGGRLIVVNPDGNVNPALGHRLEDRGYVRILVETAVESPLSAGVLIRGEKAHVTDDTLARIQGVASQDDTQQTLASFKGRYVHFLVKQTPNKPVWRLSEDDEIKWQAIAVQMDNGLALLGFSSLPRSVGFMQPAILAGKIKDVNKVGKFSRETVASWHDTIIVNADLDILDTYPLLLVDLDPNSAEAPDE